MVRTRTMWIVAAIALLTGAATTYAFMLGALTNRGFLQQRCKLELALEGSPLVDWERDYGIGKAEKARELCQLITQ